LITLDVWETIRLRCVRDGEHIKTVARDLGLSKNTVRKYVRALQAPNYQSPNRTSRLDAHCYHIDNLIRCSPKITAVRIGNQLRAFVDPDLEISQRALCGYVANRRREILGKEAFVRALYAPGGSPRLFEQNVESSGSQNIVAHLGNALNAQRPRFREAVGP
jgi:hypothetical protein